MRRLGRRHLWLLLPALAVLAWLWAAFSPEGLRALWTVLTTQRALLAHTLIYGVAVALAATALGWALAHVLNTYRVPGSLLLSLLCVAPLLVPSFTFAMGLLILLGHNGLATWAIPGVEVYGRAV